MQLEDLPNEIIANVCGYLDKGSLCELRSTSKRMSLFATPVLAKNFMSKLAVLMTSCSLESMDELCAHPDFGPHVRRIHFSSSRLRSEFVEKFSRSARETKDAREFERMLCRVMRLKSRWLGEEELREDPAMVVALLVRIFRALKRYRHPIALEMTHWDSPFLLEKYRGMHLISPDGFNNFRNCAHHDFEQDYVDIESTMEPCFKAINKTKFALDTIDLNLYPVDHRPGYFVADSSVATCYRLRRVQLLIPTSYHQDGVRSIKQLLSHAVNLEEFILQLDEWKDLIGVTFPASRFDFGEELLESVTSKRLSMLSVGECAFSSDAFTRLLTRHQSMLSRLSITGIALKDATWPQIFKWIKDNLQLLNTFSTNFLMGVKQHQPGRYRPVVVKHETKGDIHGVREIRDELDRLINTDVGQSLNQPQLQST